MNELMKAVLALVLATAAAVWLLGTALHLWPDTGQLAYGNPLPYLKVKFDRPVNAVRFWVEDYGGIPYERVWLYVNGRLAASGGPGTNATAKCGDEIAAVVKYNSGVKKLEGRILCTNPVKAPSGGEVKRAYRLIQTAKAYRAMTGDMDQTGPPLRFDGWCNIFVNGIGEASVTITVTRPDVVFCIGTSCGTSYTFKWKDIVGSIRQIVPINVFKVPDAPASQLLGGGRSVVDIYIDYYDNDYLGYTTLDVYVNGTRIASCYKQTSVSRELTSWTEYKEPNASGVYLIRFYGWRPDGSLVVFDGNIVLYERSDGTFGYRLIVNPIENPTPAELEINPHQSIGVWLLSSPSGMFYNGFFGDPYYETPDDPLYRFLRLINTNETYRNTFLNLLDKISDVEYNIPYIAVNRTGEYLVYHIYVSRQSGYATLRFKTLSISSFGAVYANTILPIDIKLPPPAVELPQTVQSSQSNQSSSQQSLQDLLRNIPRVYIVIYKG